MTTVPTDRESLIRAQGLAFATLEAILIEKGILAPGELAGGLAAMEKITTPVDAETGDVLNEWATMLAAVDAAQVGARH